VDTPKLLPDIEERIKAKPVVVAVPLVPFV
jgi:hypothetical protein